MQSSRLARSVRDCRPVGAEELAQLLRIKLGFLERREMPAARGLGYAHDVRGALEPRPRWAADVAGEEREAGRYFDPAGELRGRNRGVRVVHAHGGGDRPREPVERDVREDLVFREASFDVAVAVAPRPEFLDDPRGEPGRRVGEPERRGLGLRAVYRGVGTLGRAPGRGGLDRRALVWREV